jgi:hypothetical protein
MERAFGLRCFEAAILILTARDAFLIPTPIPKHRCYVLIFPLLEYFTNMYYFCNSQGSEVYFTCPSAPSL